MSGGAFWAFLAPMASGLLALIAATALAQATDVPLRAATAQVVPRNEALERAQGQVDSGDFEEAVKTLEAGIEQSELTDDQLVEMYRLLGLAQLYLGNEERAREAYEKLLQARPDYELPKAAPPKIRTLYARIKEDVKKRRVRPVTLTLTPLGEAKGGLAVTAEAHIEDMALGAKARLFFRRSGAQSFGSIDFVREKSSRTEYRATLPAFELPEEDASWELDYYVEVTDAAQRRLAGKGDSYNPLTFRVAAKSKDVGPVAGAAPWYQNPWVWVGVGLGVAAATTGVVLIATQTQTGTLPIKIQIDGTP